MSSLNRKITSNKSKHLLENELKRLKTFDSSYFIGKSHFEDNNTQNYLVFTDILTKSVVLVVIITFILQKLKHYLMKILELLLQKITNSIQN